MYVCVCNRVTDKQIRQAALSGVNTMSSLSAELKVATCCGKCEGCARRVLREAMSATGARSGSDVAPPLIPALATT